jgi:tetratricopeptide (TPR) repeat protein
MQLSKIVALILAALVAYSAGKDDFAHREEACRDNNIGVALLEQFHPEEAAPRFRRALEIDPGLAVAQVNLAVALLNVPDLEGAQKEAAKAAERLPDSLHARYVLGLVAKSENRVDDAIAAFSQVLAKDPLDVGAHVNRGQLHLQARRYEEAIVDFREALAAEPYNGTALYNLGLALTRAGRREEGQKALESFQELRDKGYGTSIGTAYGEQGRYASAVATTGAEPERVDAKVPDVKFVLSAPLAGTGGETEASPGGRVALFDFDGDGELDMSDSGPGGTRLYRNANGDFKDITRESGLGSGKAAVGVVAADYDNDGKIDLFVLREKGQALLHNEGGRLTDVTAAAGLPVEAPSAWSAAFADVDHDGDLDLVVVGSTPPSPLIRLFRNNGNGTFADVTPTTGLGEAEERGLAVVPTDYDNRRDLDLLVLRADKGPALFRNLRDGRFRDDAGPAGLPAEGHFTAVTAADVDKDGRIDFFFGAENGPGTFALSDGLERFRVVPGPAANTRSAQLLDYDNDGLLDLVALNEKGVQVFRNVGGGRWSEAAPAAIPGSFRGFAAGDLDRDGDQDLVLRDERGGLRVAKNEGANRSLRVDLQGRVSNRQGVGARVEMRAGSLRQRLETAAATPAFAPETLLFGLGARTRADTVRILWPSGTLQAELDPSLTARAPVVELDRKPSSCPFLYAWDGKAFEFVTDFMGGGEMGYGAGPRLWNTPVPEEWVRLRDDQLVARNGRYELRVTNELEEVLFLDRVRLLAVAHPADVDVYPNEGLVGAPRRPFRLYASGNARPPADARDDDGHDVLDRLARVDRRFVDGFPLLDVRGYAAEHALTLDLGPSRGRTLLLLTGWTDYAFSSDNLAASHGGLALRPPSLQVEDDDGQWTTAIPNIGIPVGRPQTVVVALDGLWRGKSRRVRIVTSMRIYWDEALVADESGSAVRTDALDPVVADLRERGFSAEVTPDGREPLRYDYARVQRASPWKLVPGRYTREGDVRELVREGDDVFVISRPGDEIALSFDASTLPPLAKGWRRTFLLYSDGYSKEMDINSATPDTMGPLPFRAMTRYPYDPPEAYPLTAEKRALMERYNTRVVRDSLPPLELAGEE